jgi:hypothetical protein
LHYKLNITNLYLFKDDEEINILQLKPDDINDIFLSLDQTKTINFYHYIILRRVSLAFKTCGFEE